jgi:putative nucleotidyltransferase with HDIG domain
MSAPTRILVVDDEPTICQLITLRLQKEGYSCARADGAEQAFLRLSEGAFDVVLTDVRMPGVSGMELLRTVLECSPDTAVIMVTGMADTQLAVEAMKLGAYDYVTKPFLSDELILSVKRAIEKRRLIRENRTYQERLEERVAEQTREIQEHLKIAQERAVLIKHAYEALNATHEANLDALITALDFRDNATQGHTQRVAAFALEIGDRIGLPADERETLRKGSILHDIGKIGVPDAILRKPGPLTTNEWVEMRRHVEYGYDIVRSIPFLSDAATIVLHHQEKFGGNGYPHGLKGDQIAIGARIFHVVDTLDAVMSDRPYRKGRPYSDARQEIIRFSGTQFDPDMVSVFLDVDPSRWHEISMEVDRTVPPTARFSI